MRFLAALATLLMSCATTPKSSDDVTDTVSFLELGQRSLVGFERRSQVLPLEEFNEQFTGNYETGEITFSSRDGRRVARAHFQLIGVHSARLNRFRWAWSLPKIPDEPRRLAETVRTYGVKRGFRMLTEPEFFASEEEAIAPVAIALELSDADAWFSFKNTPNSTMYLALHGIVFGEVAEHAALME